MSSTRRKLGAIRRYISVGEGSAANKPSSSPSLEKDLILRYFEGELQQCQVAVHHARDISHLPELPVHVEPLAASSTVVAAHTGPDGGLVAVARPCTPSVHEPHQANLEFIDDARDAADTVSPYVESPDGRRCVRMAAARHYALRRLAGTVTLPDWVPASPELPYDRLRLQPLTPPPPPALFRHRCESTADNASLSPRAPCDEIEQYSGSPVSDAGSSKHVVSVLSDHNGNVPRIAACCTAADDCGVSKQKRFATELNVAALQGGVEQRFESVDGSVENAAGDDVLGDVAADSFHHDFCEDAILAHSEHTDIAGVVNWNRPSARAFGASISLYERHPLTGQRAGSPVADVFGVVARANSGILVLADGVNWGDGTRLAARCAVHGCVDYLNRAIFGAPAAAAGSAHATTRDVFVTLLRSFHCAHDLILQQHGMLTTLTAAVVVPLATTSASHVVCVCNVGDSLAYVYSRRHGVREITRGSHDVNSVRDMRDALGALGPVTGRNPELNNLTLSMTQVESDDIVFVTSDGVSDNFDPVVGKFARDKPSSPPPARSGSVDTETTTGGGVTGTGAGSTSSLAALVRTPPWARHAFNAVACRLRGCGGADGGWARGRQRFSSMPPPAPASPRATCVDPWQRHELGVLRLQEVLRAAGSAGAAQPIDARQLCRRLLDFAARLTAAKRARLQQRHLYGSRVVAETGVVWRPLTPAQQRARRRHEAQRLAQLPGKLDHATVVAYQVGRPIETDL